MCVTRVPDTVTALFHTVRHVELVIESINLIEGAVAVANNVVPRAGLVITCIETPCPEPLVAGEADNAVTVCIQIMPDPGLVFAITITVGVALIMLVESGEIRCRL